MRWCGGLCLMLLLAAGARAQAQPVSDPPSRAQGAGPTDAERARAIEAQLASDPALRDDRVTIEVTGKRVRLSGTVDSADERSHAEDLVLQSDPTLTVENLLQPSGDRQAAAPASTTDELKADSRRAAHEAEKAATEVGEMVDDGWITSKVKGKLMTTDGVRASAINVDTADHVVTLRGVVRSESEHKLALRLARETTGVQKVVDELKLVPKGR
jgi:hyperosmotically inducible protein